MLNPFRVLNPTTVREAAGELRRLGEQAKVYAGGAELLLLMRHNLVQAEILVDIKRIAAMHQIDWDGSMLRIGAAVSHHRLETDPLICQRLPMFAYAESQVANIRVRNQGTLGGNLCFNDPHSDPGTALLAYEATVTLGGASGARQMPLSDFLVGMYATALQPEELLVEVQVPPLPVSFGSAYLRVHRFQRPTLGVAAAVKMQDGHIGSARLAVGCVGPRPERLNELEQKLLGASLEEARKIVRESKPYLKQLLEPVDDLLGSAEYKLYMTTVLLSRALSQAVQSPSAFTIRPPFIEPPLFAPLPLQGGEGRVRGSEAQASGPSHEGIGIKDETFESRVSSYEPKPETPQTVALSLTVNGKAWRGMVPVEETLLEFLRNRLRLIGTKRSCESEVCGACTVLVDQQAVSSCNYLAFEAHGKSVLTIEGLEDGDKLDPLQEAFIKNLGLQCGYCTPGQIMAAKALLLENPSPTRDQITEWMSGNICRCGAYGAIAASILEAARQGQKSE